MISRLLTVLLIILVTAILPAFNSTAGIGVNLKKILILYENVPPPVNGGLGDARQLWIFIVGKALYLDLIRKEKRIWVKTIRFETPETK